MNSESLLCGDCLFNAGSRARVSGSALFFLATLLNVNTVRVNSDERIDKSP